MDTPLHTACLSVAAELSLDPKLLEAVALVESGGHPDSLRFEQGFYDRYLKAGTSRTAHYGPLAACSLGVMQIMLETASEIGFLGEPWDLFDLATGLLYGAKYLKQMLDWADGDVSKALAAYNSGMLNAAKGSAPFYGDEPYVLRVQKALKGL